MKNTLIQWKLNSIVGPLYLIASEKGLQEVLFEKQEVPFAKNLKLPDPKVKILAQATEELRQYFDGRRKKFDVKIDLQGTDFQKTVWNQLMKIPYGKTNSYKDVAMKIKNEKAYRAVGTANGRNPLCIIIPCHRVIAADKTLGGYTGGLDKKITLLDIEQKNP